VKQVDFFVNGDKIDYAMKVGEGGEAFFVFQTEGDIPEHMQTSPVISPARSPVLPDAITSVLPPPTPDNNGLRELMVANDDDSTGT
jgi:phosphatidate phosphatase LPIN